MHKSHPFWCTEVLKLRCKWGLVAQMLTSFDTELWNSLTRAWTYSPCENLCQPSELSMIGKFGLNAQLHDWGKVRLSSLVGKTQNKWELRLSMRNTSSLYCTSVAKPPFSKYVYFFWWYTCKFTCYWQFLISEKFIFNKKKKVDKICDLFCNTVVVIISNPHILIGWSGHWHCPYSYVWDYIWYCSCSNW